jgi:phosphoesterase RecJ-like protein
MLLERKFDDVLKLIDESKLIVLTTHVIPDGDAIGSVISVSGYLNLKNKKNFIINHSPTPETLTFLDAHNSINTFGDNTEKFSKIIKEADLTILLDTNEFYRTKSMEQVFRESNSRKVCIDHHLGLREEEFNFAICDTSYPATCQILYKMMNYDDPGIIDKNIAEALYTGIMTDTGSFRYPRTTEETFLICSDLLRRGADPVKTYEEIYASNSVEKIKLTAKFLQGLEFFHNNEAVMGIVRKNDYEFLGLEAEQVEGFSTFLMNIKGIKAGIVLVEYKDNYKVSLRSKGEIFMNKMAADLGGGGHKNAAGATVTGKSFTEIKDHLKQLTNNYLNKGRLEE